MLALTARKDPRDKLWTAWTDADVETLKTMWRAKNSAGEIAAALSTPEREFTRNAIIGKINRLGLQGEGGLAPKFRTSKKRKPREKNPPTVATAYDDVLSDLRAQRDQITTAIHLLEAEAPAPARLTDIDAEVVSLDLEFPSTIEISEEVEIAVSGRVTLSDIAPASANGRSAIRSRQISPSAETPATSRGRTATPITKSRTCRSRNRSNRHGERIDEKANRRAGVFIGARVLRFGHGLGCGDVCRRILPGRKIIGGSMSDDLFHVVDDMQIILRGPKGVYKQTKASTSRRRRITAPASCTQRGATDSFVSWRVAGRRILTCRGRACPTTRSCRGQRCTSNSCPSPRSQNW